VADFDPLNIDLKKLSARLEQSNPKPWRQSGNALPIDNCITRLRQRRRSPKLRTRDELAQLDELACPYAIARAWLWYATARAELSCARKDIWSRATIAMRDFSERAAEVLSGLEKLDHALTTIHGSQEKAFDPAVDGLSGTPLRDMDILLAARCIIARYEDRIRQLYRRRSQDNGNLWRIEFSTTLFRPWWILTRADPTASPKGEFIEFVDAAYNSLADALPPANWESAVLTGKKRAKEEYGEAPWR
jgi:hypothetical protein